MAKAATARFEQLILEVELDPVGAAGTYNNICGMIGVQVNRTASVDTAEIPDCDDESLPLSEEKEVRSVSVTVSATGVYAEQSSTKLKDWFYNGKQLNARLRNKKAEDDGASGAIYIEEGPAILAALNESREKGQKVSAEIELQFNGTPTLTAKA